MLAYLIDKLFRSGKEAIIGKKPKFTSFQEVVDFKEHIGYAVDPATGEKTPTTWGKIHYAKDGCHIVPIKPAHLQPETFSFGEVLLQVQRALLGVVTPELRAVVIDIDNAGKILYVRFYYDGEVSEELIDLWDCAITEIDTGLAYLFDQGIERLDYPKEIPFRGRYAYRRKE